ncbi:MULTISPECIES: S9 family peptidase [unclassified Azospirillum]|uniref:alpha/beta hydrolase family protein n=1 Tax=unclassified Azospirillum TaxID=2630922 RepID=UPI000B6ADEDA|nr:MULTISPECIES: S9 family peptidase [unclassified Azospirillum]SNR92023.1 Dipeptidyl aminopeptidase/acylaminoacyl peptidase [Azospirillum sp. RU38E]SNS07930.1 Dipeptidyl aminopeptidase/acylaminoacyl peptidase [Azospirillum sp. RU37A]
MRFTFKAALALVVGLSGWSLPGWAQPAPTPAAVEIFANPASLGVISLSPNGEYVAYLAPLNGRQHLAVQKTRPAPGERPSVFAPPDEAEIIQIDWVNEERLILSAMATQKVPTSMGIRAVRFQRLIAINRDGSKAKVLLNRGAETGGYYLTSTPILQFIDREHVLALFPTSGQPEPDVVRLDVYTGLYGRVRRAMPNLREYLPDPTGQIRIATTYNDRTGVMTYLRRDSADESYRPMKRADIIRHGIFDVLGFSRDGAQLYVATNTKESDRAGIHTYDLDKDELGPRLLEDAKYSIGEVVMKQGAVVAFSWTDDLPQRRWLDPVTQDMQEKLDKAVPNSREVIMDVSDDGKVALVASYSPTEPTVYRLFFRDSKRFEYFGDSYPGLPTESVAARRPVTFKARDGQDIPAYLTLPVGRGEKNLPFIVMPHGGPQGRDDGEFDVLSQFLANRGYAVIQPNFRGSTGMGGEFREAGYRQWGGLMQDDVTDAAQWAVAQGYADPARMCILGWSYGGYAALMGAVKTPDLFKCAVATAPVANMDRLYDDLRKNWAKNYSRDRIYGEADGFDPSNSPVHRAAEIKVPVLLIHGDRDVQADVGHSRDMEKALLKAGKAVEYIEIKEMDHYPMNREDMVRIMTAWERFLKAQIGN